MRYSMDNPKVFESLPNQCGSEGTPIFIYQGAPKDASKAPSDLDSGDSVKLPGAAVVVSRFPKA